MLDICYEELDYMKDRIEEGLEKEKFLDTWDFEDDYSHNHIDKNRDKFIELANEYFKESNLNYRAYEGCENAIVEKLN